MIKISVKNISITVLLSFLFFSCISCGGGTGTIEAVSVPNGEFQKFVSDGQGMAPEQFVDWWNNTERYNGWTFSYYGQNGIVWPDNSTAEEIYQSRVINCYRISKICQAIFGGELIFVSQPNSNYDHYYLRLKNGKIDNNGLILKFSKE